MKKLLGILVLGLLWCNISFAFTKGTGEVKMSNRALNHFISYVHGESNFKDKSKFDKKPTPQFFILSSDGDWSSAWFCPWKHCGQSKVWVTIKECERETGVLCGVFAARRIIYWDNGINKKNKKAKFNSKMTDEEIKSKLTRLGFYGGTTSTTKPKITKKTTTTSSDNSSDIVTQLKELKKLFNDGILTQEEFDKAKKKLLN